jgi:hypothetical protein
MQTAFFYVNLAVAKKVGEEPLAKLFFLALCCWVY